MPSRVSSVHDNQKLVDRLIEEMAAVWEKGRQAGAEEFLEPHPELREDILAPCDTADAILSQAQDAEKPFFRVPKVIER